VARILVTGGTGAIGPAVVTALVEAGHWVRVLSRSPIGRDVAPSASQLIQGDITLADDVSRAVRGMDAVIHLAALLHVPPSRAQSLAGYRRVNVDGLRHTLAAARDAGVKRLVLASTIAVYGEAPAAVATEETTPAPETDYARTKLEAEQAVLADFRGADRSAVVLRLAAVYGSRMKGNYRQLVRALDRGRFVAPGPGHNRRSLVHDSDVAAAFALAVSHPAAAGRTFNVADRRPYPIREIIGAIAQAIGRRPPAIHLPVPVALPAASIVEVLARLADISPPFSRAMVRKYNEEIAVNASAIARDLGFAPRMTLESGWRQTVEALRQAGELG
jgi:UDP-glucose 4-epimerase